MSQSKPLTIIATLFLTLAQAITCFPQTPSTFPAAQDETVRVATTVVQTEAIVTDKSGRRINGLKASDFQVTDEGAPQAIDFFTVIEGSRVQGGNPATATTDNAQSSSLSMAYEGRHIALVFDDTTLSLENFNRSRKAFADFINTKMSPNDMVALMSTGGALASLQQFTNDKQRLLSALNRVAAQSGVAERARRPQSNMTPAEALRIDSGDRKVLETVRRRIDLEESGGMQGSIANQQDVMPINNAGAKGSGEPAGGGDGNMDARVRTQAKAYVSEIGQNTRNNISTLQSLFKAMADLPGRKIAVLLTESFVTAAGTSEDISNQLTQLIEVARRSGVSVYALDAAGLRTNNATASENLTGSGMALRNANPDLTLSSFEELAGARLLVTGTGGEFISNTNSLVNGLERAMEDSSFYYVLGFKPAVLDNKFHRLNITVKGKSDLIVRTRRGYLAANPETIRGTEAELVQALKSPVAVTALPVDLVANVVPKAATGEQTTQIGLHVGRNYLSLPAATAPDQTATYDILAYVFAAGRDTPVAEFASGNSTLTYDFAKNPDLRQKIKKEGLIVVNEFKLNPGIYQVRAVVREKSTGTTGSAYQFFEVPDPKDKKTVSMSSILMSATGQTGFSGANSFKPGSDVDVRFLIYNLPKEVTGLVQRVKLMDATGKAWLDSELPLAPPAGSDRAKVVQGTSFNLPTMRGRYALVVTLKDAKGKVDVERRTDFLIDYQP